MPLMQTVYPISARMFQAAPEPKSEPQLDPPPLPDPELQLEPRETSRSRREVNHSIVQIGPVTSGDRVMLWTGLPLHLGKQCIPIDRLANMAVHAS